MTQPPRSFSLDGETGSFELRGADVSFNPPDAAGLWLNRTIRAIAEAPTGAEDSLQTAPQLQQEIEGYLDILRKIDDPAIRDVALGAIVSAFSLGFHHPGDPSLRKAIEAEAKRLFNQQRTAAANAARRTPDCILQIIERRVRDLWLRRPSLRHQLYATAEGIVSGVVADIREAYRLSEEPGGWQTKGFNDPCLTDDDNDTHTRWVNKIAKQAKRLVTDV